jgi:3-deoxy-7-phosphoheptulonate synthase
MIISMRPHASRAEIDHVCERIREFGYKIHTIEGEERVVIGVVGVGDVTACLESLEASPGVERAVRISAPYKFVSREFKKEHSSIRVNGLEIGGDEFIVMAGPCSVESERQIMQTAEAVAAAGAKMLRGGAFKPRSSPYSFQGLGEEALKILAEARELYGMAVITEVMGSDEVDLVAEYADILQLGTRNMQNYRQLEAVGRQQKPVLLKRGMSSTIEELLLAAEYILSSGNPNVLLCERGIRTFETATRGTFDVNAVPVLKKLSHLPVIVDPSHAVGRWDLVAPISRAAIAAGADGLIIEVHGNPEQAMSDGAQSLRPGDYAELLRGVERVAEAVDRSLVLQPSGA